jgi:hypothetical protein
MRRLVCSLACVLAWSAQAQETEVTVLGVLLPGADYNKAVSFLNDLADPIYWTYPNDVGVSVRLGNWGVPVPMPAPLVSNGSGSDLDQFYNAILDEQTHQLRYDADVVMFFTGEFSNPSCGLAFQINWTSLSGAPVGSRWNPGGNGLDLNGAETSFAAIVSTVGPNCGTFVDTAIHELGHLFGVGHEYPPATLACCLNNDSHAAVFQAQLPWPMPPGGWFRTITSQAISPTFSRVWAKPPGSFYTPIPWYANERGTVVQTGVSVANYRTTVVPPPPPPPVTPPPPLPPGCSLQTPTTVSGVQTGVCVGSPPVYTSYNMYWGDACQGATDYYQVEHSQPIGMPYQVTGTTLSPWTGILVEGPDSMLRVRSCQIGVGCTSLSSDFLVVQDVC